MVFAHDDGVGFPLGGAAGAVVKKANFGHAINHRNAVRLLLMRVPGLDDPGIDGAEVGLSESGEVRIVFPKNFHHTAAVIAVLDQGDQLHSVDHETTMEERDGVERTMRAVGDNRAYRVWGFEAWGG